MDFPELARYLEFIKKHERLRADLLGKATDLRAEIEKWYAKYKELEPKLRESVFKEASSTPAPQPGKQTKPESKPESKIIAMTAAVTRARTAAAPASPEDTKLVSISGETVSPDLARKYLRESFHFIDKGWERVTAGIKKMTEELEKERFSRENFETYDKMFRQVYQLKAKWAGSGTGRRKYAEFVAGMPVPLTKMTNDLANLIAATVAVLDENYVNQQNKAVLVEALNSFLYSIFALFNGVVLWITECLQAGISFDEASEILETIGTFRNILMTISHFDYQLMNLGSELCLLYSYSNLELQRLLMLTIGIESK